MNPTAAQLRQMKRENLCWPPVLGEVDYMDWPNGGRGQLAVWRSRTFLVQAFPEPNDIIRLSVNRTEWDERTHRWRSDISWDDLQRLKAEAGYGDRWAVEVLPAAADVVNVANMRHIWLLPEAPEFAWRKAA